MSFRVPFIRPVFPPADRLSADFASIEAANWYTNFGPKEREFSARLAKRFGDEYLAVTFANATIALMASIHLAVGRGDGSRRILVPSFTFAAGPEAIQWCGYEPAFVDIDVPSLQPSLDSARALLGAADDIVAVLLCNTFGIGNAEVDQWERLAAEHDLPLIVDSAAGFGSAYPDGSPVGSAGTCEIFSFHATKPFAIGEGGAVLTKDGDLASRLTEFTNFGFRASSGAVGLGLNGKLQEINAAIGLRQLETFDAMLDSRQSLLRRYRAALPASIVFPHNIERSSVCFASMLLPDREKRDAAQGRLVAAGVEARTYYSPPVHQQPLFVSARVPLPRTEEVVGRVLSVPLHAWMHEDDVLLVLESLNEEANSW